MNGQLIDRDHPRLEGAVNVLAKTYDMINDPEFKEYADILTAKSHLTGKKINRFCNIHQSVADLLAKQRMGDKHGQVGSALLWMGLMPYLS